VRKAVRDGRISLDARGRIDSDAADAAWAANTDPARGGRPDQRAVAALVRGRHEDLVAETAPPEATIRGVAGAMPPGMTLNDARMLREWNQAQLIQQQRLKDAGVLVEASKVEDAAFTAARTARDLLMAIPDRVDATFAAITDPAEIHRRLTEELRTICDEFARLLLQDPDAEEVAS
jgi:hypothetical protein